MKQKFLKLSIYVPLIADGWVVIFLSLNSKYNGILAKWPENLQLDEDAREDDVNAEKPSSSFLFVISSAIFLRSANDFISSLS